MNIFNAMIELVINIYFFICELLQCTLNSKSPLLISSQQQIGTIKVKMHFVRLFLSLKIENKIVVNVSSL